MYISDADMQKAFRNIKKYKEKVQTEVSKEILRAAYSIVNKAKINLTQNRSVKTGKTRAELKVVKNLSKFQAKAGIDSPIGAYLEFGTPPHIIRAKNAKVLAAPISKGGFGQGIGGFIVYGTNKFGKVNIEQRYIMFGKEVHHPGSKAKPFLFPAAESERPRYIERIHKILNGEKGNNK